MPIEHTPGPWIARKRAWDWAVDGDGHLICGLPSSSHRQEEANVHLIAAAPELYESLKEICTCPTEMWTGSEINDSTCELSEEAHYALAKAEGHS